MGLWYSVSPPPTTLHGGLGRGVILPWKVGRHFASQDLHTGQMSEGVLTAIWVAHQPYTLGAGEKGAKHREHTEPAFKGLPVGEGQVMHSERSWLGVGLEGVVGTVVNWRYLSYLK